MITVDCEIRKWILIFFCGIHFVLFLLHLFIFFINRGHDERENRINLAYSLFNLNYFMLILFMKLLFLGVSWIAVSVTYLLICSTAYLGYLFFGFERYKRWIIVLTALTSLLCLLSFFWGVMVRFFYLSAALFAFFYIAILLVLIFKRKKGDVVNLISSLGFIAIYIGFICQGVARGSGTSVPIVISSTYTVFIVVAFSFYFSYRIYEKNQFLRLSNRKYEQINHELSSTITLLKRANKIIEAQKKERESRLKRKVLQIDEMNVEKYNLKPRVKEAVIYTLQGMTDEEIGRKMDRSESMVKKYLAIARELVNEEGYFLRTKQDIIAHFRQLSD